MADNALSVDVRLVEGSTSLATGRTHSVVVDRPIEKGGNDLGFLGGELLLAAQGGCYLSNLVAAARGRNITLRRAVARVSGKLADHPPHFGEITVELDLEADTTDEDLARLMTIAERGCIVTNTLKASTPLVVRRSGEPTTAGTA